MDNKKWLEFILSHQAESGAGGMDYVLFPEDILKFLLENDFIK